MKGSNSRIVKLIAVSILGSIYSGTLLIAKIFGRRGRPLRKNTGKILIIGTFHNPNWFRSHIRPIARSGYGEVILVCDEVVDTVDSVVYEIPPRLMSRLLSRALSKLIWSIYCSFKYRPDIYMGYHIFPAAISALVVGRLFGKSACYQVTSGPTELEGGGWYAENALLSLIGSPSEFIENLAHRIVREFDLVVVRGKRAEEYVRRCGYTRELAIITGSVEVPANWVSNEERDIDLIFVGRLAETKRPDRFVSIVAQVVTTLPDINVAIVGDGPEFNNLLKQVESCKLASVVDMLGKQNNVPDMLMRSKIFVLTSRSEGLSIAMLEAMTSGAVPVVSDVGDLRDVINDGRNGFVIEQDDIEMFSEKIVHLLSDNSSWERFSHASIDDAISYSGIEIISEKWRNCFETLAPESSGH